MKSGFMKHINELVRQCDIVVEVLDARYPSRTRNSMLERMVIEKDKVLMFVLNKSDLIDTPVAEKTKKELLAETKKVVIFMSAKEREGINLLRIEIGKASKGKKKIVIGIIGYPNVGKSTLINALAGRGRARVTTSRKAGLTRGLQKIAIADGAYLIDAPGIIPTGEEEFDLFLIDAKNPNQLKDPELCAVKLVTILGNAPIAKYYGIENFEGMDEDALIEAIAEKKRLFAKGGVPDVGKASRDLLERYQKHDIR